MIKKIFGLFIVSFLSLVYGASSVSADTYVVTKTSDETGTCNSGTDCALREAISAANAHNGDDIITLPANTYTLSIPGTLEDGNTTGDLDVYDSDNSLTINGASATSSIINANGIDRVFHVWGSGSLIINNITVEGGRLNNRDGGGINCDSVNSNLTIQNSIIENNSVITAINIHGGGIYFDGAILSIANSIIQNNTTNGPNNHGAGLFLEADSATIQNSLINNNQILGEGSGGGLMIYDTSPVNIINTTISNNKTTKNGGGISANGCCGSVNIMLNNCTVVNNQANSSNLGSYRGGAINVENSAIIYIKNSILSNNTKYTTQENCFTLGATIISDGFNIDSGTTCGLTGTDDQQSIDPLLNALAANGGVTNTFSLQASSPAKDAIPSANCTDHNGTSITTDQRGLARPDNSYCEIGAYELDQAKPMISVIAGNDTIECNRDTWTDAGAAVEDNQDNIFSSVISATADGAVIEETPGNYIISYSASDNENNSAVIQNRTVIVQDTIVPSIAITGDEIQAVSINSIYTDPGVIFSDLCDLTTATVTTTGSVDTTIPGTYTLVYSASDASNNPAIAKTRTVTVVDVDGDQDGIYSYLDPDDTKADTVLQYTANSDYYLILRSNGKKLYLVNLTTNKTLNTITLSKKIKYSINSLKLFNYRNKKFAVVVSKKKAKILTSLVYPNIGSGKLTKKDQQKLTNKNIKPSKTKKNKNYLQLKNKKSKTLEQYFVNNKYKLILK